jgi:hypothetical protein
MNYAAATRHSSKRMILSPRSLFLSSLGFPFHFSVASVCIFTMHIAPPGTLILDSGVDAYSLHKDARRNFKRPAVMCSVINYMWSADLIFYQNYARENKGNKYILIAVDCLSKFMYAEAMKKKTSDDTIEAFKKIFKRSKSTPTKLWVDMGTEFYAKKTRAFLESKWVKLYSVKTSLKASLAERYVRRLKTIIERIFTDTKRHDYLSYLESVVTNINNSFNRSVQMRPIDVNKKNEKKKRKGTQA